MQVIHNLHVANSAPVLTPLDTSGASVIAGLSILLEIASWLFLLH